MRAWASGNFWVRSRWLCLRNGACLNEPAPQAGLSQKVEARGEELEKFLPRPAGSSSFRFSGRRHNLYAKLRPFVFTVLIIFMFWFGAGLSAANQVPSGCGAGGDSSSIAATHPRVVESRNRSLIAATVPKAVGREYVNLIDRLLPRAHGVRSFPTDAHGSHLFSIRNLVFRQLDSDRPQNGKAGGGIARLPFVVCIWLRQRDVFPPHLDSCGVTNQPIPGWSLSVDGHMHPEFVSANSEGIRTRDPSVHVGPLRLVSGLRSGATIACPAGNKERTGYDGNADGNAEVRWLAQPIYNVLELLGGASLLCLAVVCGAVGIRDVHRGNSAGSLAILVAYIFGQLGMLLIFFVVHG